MYMDLSPEAEAEEKHEVFGDKQHFWTKYDRLANRHDKEMVGGLNDHLDVLLLFAGLFAGIETAFISFTVINLSPNLSQQTNYLLQQLLLQVSNGTLSEIDLNPPPFVPPPGAIRQNCFFFASLCSSLMAATGAVLAKQWLSNYERTSYTGSLESQALHRTEKFLALETWGLHVVVEALPTLLLISFALFFIALIDYLWTIHHVLALVVLAFSAAGVLAYLYTLIAAAMDSCCPFQTPVSLQISGAVSMIGRVIGATFWWKRVKKLAGMMEALGRDRASLARLWAPRNGMKDESSHNQVSTLSTCDSGRKWRPWVSDPSRDKVLAGTSSMLSLEHRRALRKEELSAQSIVYLLKYSTSEDDLRSVADNIPALIHPEPVRLIARSPFFPRLLNQLIQTRLGLACEGNHKLEADALAYSVAVAHVLAADPTAIRDMIYEVIRDRDTKPKQSKISRDVFALEVGIVGLCLNVKPSGEGCGEVRLSVLAAGRAAGASNLNTSTKAVIRTLDMIERQTALSLSTLLALSGSALATSNDYISKIPPTNSFFSLAALSLRQEIQSGIGLKQPIQRRVDTVWLARSGKDVKSLMIAALNVHNEFLLAPQRNIGHFLKPYTTLIRRFRSLHSHQCRPPYLQQTSTQHSPFRTSASLNPIASLTCTAASTSPTAQDVLVRCLSNLALLFGSFGSLQPRAAPYFDPETERDLKAYALQLFLSLECRTLVGDSWSLSQLQASAVTQALIALDLREVVVDTEIIGVLRVLWNTLTSLPTERDPYRVISHPSLSLLIVQALDSTSFESSRSAYKLLDHVGSIFEGDTSTEGTRNAPHSIGGQLGRAVIHSWVRSLVRGSTALRDIIDSKHLLRWIVRSATTDPSLAILFGDSGVAHLFQLVVPMLSREIARKCKVLAQYVREFMPKIRLAHVSSTGDLEILVRRTLFLVEQVVQSTPAAASVMALDEAYESLILELRSQDGEELSGRERDRRRCFGRE
ncbi:hypothetical protein FRB98_009699 [Tulasnella sp. 332]|nr:hypothetical protein FRB98_009699 [Tulasnella sp. 332]